jgi:RHS repeat-associated protein
VFASVNTAPAYSYDAYGVALQGTAPLANLNYAGMFLNSDSGLYLTQYRAYDPIVGRWLSRDPLTEVGDVNLYRYVGDAPTVYRDPSGLWQVTVSGGDGIGGIVTIGYNSGQWSFGAWGGVGAGLSARYDPENKPCQPSGFVPSARINANWQAGSFGGGGVNGTFTSPNTGSVTGSISYGKGLAGSITANPQYPAANVSASALTLGAGTSAAGGIGGTYTRPSSQCGC